jgi:fatty acid desaturase
MADAADLRTTSDALQPPEEAPAVTEAFTTDTSPQHQPKKRRRRTQRRIAKALMWFALLFSAVAVLSEPWLLVPVVAVAAALVLWD